MELFRLRDDRQTDNKRLHLKFENERWLPSESSSLSSSLRAARRDGSQFKYISTRVRRSGMTRCSSACGKTGLTDSLAVFCGSSQEAMHNQSPSCFVILQHEPSASYLNRIKMQRREEECVRAGAAGGAACAAVTGCKLIKPSRDQI